MPSRSGFSTLLVVLLLIALIGLLLWLAPQIERWLHPGQAARSLEGQLQPYLNPTPTIRPDPATIVRQVQNLSRLETAAYTIEKVITAASGQGGLAFLFGDRLIFVAHGRVIAGVDLSLVREGDIVVTDDDRVVMALPAAEVFVATLDNEQSYVYDRETGLFGMNPELETAARQAAEQEILDAALEDGILELAEANARAYLRQLIISFGFQDVIFVPRPLTPAPLALPVTVVPVTPTP